MANNRTDENKIKSRDLCERCSYGNCYFVSEEYCRGCELLTGDKCYCNTIRYKTPCEKFEDKDGGED